MISAFLAISLFFGAVNVVYEEADLINSSAIVEEVPESVEQEHESFDFGNWLESVFTPETVAHILEILTVVTVVVKLASSLKKAVGQKVSTTQEVCDKVVDILKTTNKDSVNKAISELIKPLEKQLNEITPVLNAFAKVLVLSQENTPEARLAILELLQQVGNVSDKIVEEAKAEIEKQVEEEQAKKKETVAELDEIEQSSVEGRY